MTCEQATDLLNEVLDGTEPMAEHRAADQHVAGCSACRALAADLRAIRVAARRLETRQPSPQVWERLQARVAAERRGTDSSAAFESSLPRTAWRPWWGAAAALLVATTIGVSSLTGRLTVPSTAAGQPGVDANGSDLVASVEAELQAAESHYEKAIEGLEVIARGDTGELEPQVAAVLQKNLQVIDAAIDETRAAVRAQPSSVDAQESLFGAMRDKVSLLQQTIELINEMRKGNQAEAGRIVQGLNQP